MRCSSSVPSSDSTSDCSFSVSTTSAVPYSTEVLDLHEVIHEGNLLPRSRQPWLPGLRPPEQRQQQEWNFFLENLERSSNGTNMWTKGTAQFCLPRLSSSHFVSGTRRDFHSGEEGQDARKHVMSILKSKQLLMALQLIWKKVKIVSIQ